MSRHRITREGWLESEPVRAEDPRGGAAQRAGNRAGARRPPVRYEKKETRAFGGCSRVVFRVFAARGLVPVSTTAGPTLSRSGSVASVSNGSVPATSGKPRYMIVGIDPGTTTALAALDLDGNLLHLESPRQMTMSDVIEALYKVGKPLVIASDVEEMPFTVEKIRRAFSAIAYTPKQDTAWRQGRAYCPVTVRERPRARRPLRRSRRIRPVPTQVPEPHQTDHPRGMISTRSGPGDPGTGTRPGTVDLHAVTTVAPGRGPRGPG